MSLQPIKYDGLYYKFCSDASDNESEDCEIVLDEPGKYKINYIFGKNDNFVKPREEITYEATQNNLIKKLPCNKNFFQETSHGSHLSELDSVGDNNACYYNISKINTSSALSKQTQIIIGAVVGVVVLLILICVCCMSLSSSGGSERFVVIR